jgi:asparagine synthase (glutamine-hydrolysing)
VFHRLNRVAGYLRAWGRVPSFLRRSAANTLEVMGGSSVSAMKTAAILRSDGSLAQVYPTARQVLSSQQRYALCTEPWLNSVDRHEDSYVQMLQNTFSDPLDIGLISRVSFAEARTYLHDVLLRDTDQMSMAHGLEVRVPLLDHKLVEKVMGLSDLHKRSNGTPKRLLVESLHGMLPQEIVHRPKQGFTLPLDCWMRGKLRSYCENRLGPQGLGRRGMFQPEQVQRLWQDFLAKRRSVTWSRLWVLVVLEDWLEHNNIDCSVAA